MLVFDEDYIRRTYGDELYNRCKSFLFSFRQDWREDESIVNLVCVCVFAFHSVTYNRNSISISSPHSP